MHNETDSRQIKKYPELRRITGLVCECGAPIEYVYPMNNTVRYRCLQCGRTNAIPTAYNLDAGKGSHMDKVKREAKARDRYQCVLCGRSQKLHVHHIVPRSKRPDLQYHLLNLMTLCEDCHHKTHQFYKDYSGQPAEEADRTEDLFDSLCIPIEDRFYPAERTQEFLLIRNLEEELNKRHG